MDREKSIILMAVLFVFLVSPVFVFGETIILKSGQKFKGRIIEKTDSYVKIEVAGMPVTFYLDKIEKIEEVGNAPVNAQNSAETKVLPEVKIKTLEKSVSKIVISKTERDKKAFNEMRERCLNEVNPGHCLNFLYLQADSLTDEVLVREIIAKLKNKCDSGDEDWCASYSRLELVKNPIVQNEILSGKTYDVVFESCPVDVEKKKIQKDEEALKSGFCSKGNFESQAVAEWNCRKGHDDTVSLVFNGKKVENTCPSGEDMYVCTRKYKCVQK